MKKFAIASIIFGLLVITSGTGLFFWWQTQTQAPSTNSQSKRILITKGMTAEGIGALLEKEGVIKSSLAFKFYTQLTDLSQKMQAGEFSVPTNLKLEDMIKKLLSGPTEIWVTIPEGLRREQVAQKFSEEFGIPETEFLNLSQNLEGYLFPETYLFPKTASASAVIKRLTNTFEDKTKDLSVSKNDVILASILERETKTADEAPIVAGILTNRLQIGMALQTDATVQYAVGTKENWWRTPTKADLLVNSPYNTYKFPGLPPAPISSPGLIMLKAAANPTNTDYFYYIHDSEGAIHYARTLEEHNSNVQKYLR